MCAQLDHTGPAVGFVKVFGFKRVFVKLNNLRCQTFQAMLAFIAMITFQALIVSIEIRQYLSVTELQQASAD
jgi:hypothetical protein